MTKKLRIWKTHADNDYIDVENIGDLSVDNGILRLYEFPAAERRIQPTISIFKEWARIDWIETE